MKCFKSSSPKESKKKMSCFGSISSILHQCVPHFRTVSVRYNEGIFSFFFRCHSCMVNKFIHMIRGKTPTKSSSIYMFFEVFSNCELLIPLLIFVKHHQRDYLVYFLLCSVFLPQRSSLCQNSMLVERFYF